MPEPGDAPAPAAAPGDAPVPAAVDLIHAKRDGRVLSDDEVRWLIASYVRGEVADEQMSALLMAIFFRGLGPAELRPWTAAMIASGERLDLSGVGRPTVDKWPHQPPACTNRRAPARGGARPGGRDWPDGGCAHPAKRKASAGRGSGQTEG